MLAHYANPTLRAVLSVAVLAQSALGREETAAFVEIPERELSDRIRGGMLGQIIGNLNGLPHEAKYIHEPGSVAGFRPHLPDGARTDDDTDLEWVYLCEIERTGNCELPPGRIVELWRSYINDGIWCANRYARNLMDLGLEPPQTGNLALNPWAHFNIAGQFVCESFGMMAPAMPQTASRLATHYTRVSIDGEPAQATQLFASMIAVAFIEADLSQILDSGMAAVDPHSEIATIVQDTRAICAQEADWRTARARIKQRWQRHDGAIRDWNGYELNTASTIAALIYGQGDFLRTIELALNFGWDCDNNAATAATILGVRHGRAWMNRQGWKIADVYRNTTRRGMPRDETISRFEDRLIACAKLVIQNHGGCRIDRPEGAVWRIPVESAANVEPLPGDSAERLAPRMAGLVDSRATDTDRARAAYLAICTDEADRLERENAAAWGEALKCLAQFGAIVDGLYDMQIPSTAPLRERAVRVGLRRAAHESSDSQP